MTRWRATLAEPVVQHRGQLTLHRPTCWHVNGGRGPSSHDYAWIEDGSTLETTDRYLFADALGACCFRDGSTPWQPALYGYDDRDGSIIVVADQ